MTLIISPDLDPVFTSTTPGSVPASGGGSTNFLRADGTWSSPAAGSFLSASTTSTQDGYFTGINLLEGGTTPTFYTRIINSTDLTASTTLTLAGLGTVDRTITFPGGNASVTLATIANVSQTFNGVTTFGNATVTVGSSTAASTYGFGTGATIAAATKTIDIGTNGVATSITNITLGSQTSTTTTNIYGDIDQAYDVPQLGLPFSSAIHYLEPQAGLSLSTVTLNVSTGVFSCTGTTTLTVGQVIRLSGTNTGALITGYVNPTDYYVISATGAPTTSFTLSATLGGASITATGTTGSTGLNYTTATGATAFGATSPYIAGQTVFAGGAIPVLTLNSGSNTSSIVVIQTANNAYTWNFNSLGALSAPGSISASGSISTTAQLVSTVAAGTAPLSVTSNTVVPNLNASLLSGNGVGTSGAAIPLLNATNTFSGLTTFSNGVTVSGATTTLTTGTATVAPLTFAAGTNLTTAAAGRVEYDGSFFYATRETTSGRGSVSIDNIFRLAANGTAITTIANFYGATSALNLAASSVYDIEYHIYFTKTTAGTATFTLTASSAPTLIFATLMGTPVGGVGAGTPQSLTTSSQNATTAAFGATGSLTTAVNHVYLIKGRIHTNLATTLNLQLACSAGSATPLAGSYYSIKRISSSQGSFA